MVVELELAVVELDIEEELELLEVVDCVCTDSTTNAVVVCCEEDGVVNCTAAAGAVGAVDVDAAAVRVARRRPAPPRP